MTGALGGAELAKGFGLNLANALTGDVEFLADFLEGMLALASDAEAQTYDLLFFRREGFQDIGSFVANVGIDDGIDGRTDPTILD